MRSTDGGIAGLDMQKNLEASPNAYAIPQTST